MHEGFYTRQLSCQKEITMEGKAPDFHWLIQGEERKKIHLVGLGDVGLNVALGLTLMGGDLIEEIGLYDLNRKQMERMEMELGQIQHAASHDRVPEIRCLEDADLFACDVFLFCATRAVPALDSEAFDVRMAQYEANAGIVSGYARKAAREGYRGLFVVVSDPVDLLCQTVYQTSLETGQPLHPWQIVGTGLGVMHARAVYFAGKNKDFAAYQTYGRCFGPHGADLVVADDVRPDHYDEKRSLELTRLTVTANLRVRELGFKPYIAPAMSSAVLTLLALLKGEWQDSAIWLNGLYFGVRNRQTDKGPEIEELPLPEALYQRLLKTYRHLEEIVWK